MAAFMFLIFAAIATIIWITKLGQWIAIGEIVPNISWITIQQEFVNLQQFRGSWVLLCYWCPCTWHRVDMLSIGSIYRDKLHKQLQVLIIDAPYKSDLSLEEFADKNHLPGEFTLISYDKASNDRTVFDLGVCRPIYLLINPEGILHRYRNNAFRSENLDNNNSRDNINDHDEEKTLANVNKFIGNNTVDI